MARGGGDRIRRCGRGCGCGEHRQRLTIWPSRRRVVSRHRACDGCGIATACRICGGQFDGGAGLRQPFGGFKQSGIGREGGPEGITGFVEYQAIIK
ncbi:aldehyde dehydrogenase family protein [Mycobacterium xenopi 4042]|uniref:Aldehyde dehydrogenase family protein n=1 Tax=Mycobacterium xenopi 4042 TaxID=1299334 RepID=X8AFE8_MYCXE|nr:aldehyde dehydrogenase family protein [Mycobacterium xenopi 4042]